MSDSVYGRDLSPASEPGRGQTSEVPLRSEEHSPQLRSLRALIQEDFPLAAFMGVEPRSWDEAGLQLWVPAGPSANVHGTMFGGGIAAVGILAGWGWLRLELEARGRAVPVVVQDARTTFVRPIHGPCVAWCIPPTADRLDRFLRALDRRGRGRLGLRVEISPDGTGAMTDPTGVPVGDAFADNAAAPAAVVEARFAAVPDPRV